MGIRDSYFFQGNPVGIGTARNGNRHMEMGIKMSGVGHGDGNGNFYTGMGRNGNQSSFPLTSG